MKNPLGFALPPVLACVRHRFASCVVPILGEKIALAEHEKHALRLVNMTLEHADIAQVMGSDVKSATVQLAKALEDPKRGLTALSRSGITFNEAQTETIKKLVDSGKLLDAQALILDTETGYEIYVKRDLLEAV